MGGIKKVGGTSATGGAAGTPATADPADVHAMRAAMNEEPERPELSSLFSTQGAAAAKADAVDPDGAGRGGGEADEDAENLAADVAERVLVTDREYSDDEEVRIYLKDSVLKDTEVHLRRGPEVLDVRVQTGDRGSHGILLGAKDALGRRLEETCDVPVRLDIVLVGAGD